ncbi:hypothetical protein JVT61DRAFT_12251 [Boletus reticuloceps]|uniref:Uncharacterized protein n=1 Tax=Boletus reticuloceps TaxID=495285 RepID=A0A8I2YED5_9AGAM|nr:hypothetical protein JVT61DRAFT_12251 [Boletus reticuloceps]
MAVAAMVTSNQLSGPALTVDAVSQANVVLADNASDAQKSKSQISARSSSYRPAPRIDDSPTPSVGIVAACMMQVEPEKERWRGIAKEWYAHSIADAPWSPQPRSRNRGTTSGLPFREKVHDHFCLSNCP